MSLPANSLLLTNPAQASGAGAGPEIALGAAITHGASLYLVATGTPAFRVEVSRDKVTWFQALDTFYGGDMAVDLAVAPWATGKVVWVLAGNHAYIRVWFTKYVPAGPDLDTLIAYLQI